MKLFQKDYWSMNDHELALEATKYNIPHIGRAGEHGEHWFTDRDYVITRLLSRDTSLRSNITLVFSVIAISISIASLLISLFKK